MKILILFLSLLYYLPAGGQIIHGNANNFSFNIISNTLSSFSEIDFSTKDSLELKSNQLSIFIAYSYSEGTSIGINHLEKFNLGQNDTLRIKSNALSFGINHSIKRFYLGFGLDFSNTRINFTQNTRDNFSGSHNNSTAGYSGYNDYIHYYDSKFNWINTSISVGYSVFKSGSKFNITPIVKVLPGFFVNETRSNSLTKRHSHYESYGPTPPYSTVIDSDTSYVKEIYRINKFNVNYRLGIKLDFEIKNKLNLNLEVGKGLFRTSFLNDGETKYYNRISFYSALSLVYIIN